MMDWIRKWMIAILAAILLMAVGCGTDGSTVSEGGQPLSDGHTVVLAAGRHLAPGEKDAYYCSKVLEVWEPLITQKRDGTPKGKLAESWEMKDGGKEWIFHLRQGVRFHNGTPFNADAVIKNLDRMKLGVKRSIFYGLDIKTFYPSLLRYEKLDDYTVRLLFQEPNVNELYKMMDFGSPMFAPECFDGEGNFSGFAVGTGPYKIEENQLGKYVRLVKNEDYYGEKAHIQSFIIRNIPNPDVRYAALKAGEISGVLDINAIPPFLAEELKKDPRFHVSVNKSTMIRFLALNGTKFPFNDARMRRAVSLAIDRENLVQALYMGYGSPTSNILNYTSPYYKAYPVEHDMAEAKSLARDVLGEKRMDIVYCINGAEPLQKGEAELIAYWLKDIGLDVTIQSMEYAAMARQIRKGDYHIARLQQGLPNGDPYSILYTFMMPDGGRNKASSLGYQNQEVIELMEKVKHLTDERERRDIYGILQEISVKDQPVAPLFNDMSIVASDRRLKQYEALIYGVDLSHTEWDPS